MPETHLIVSSDEYGFYAQSPQLPGFAFGRPTQVEFMAEYREALRREGVSGRVIGHLESRFETAEGEVYVLRRCTDPEAEPAARDLLVNHMYSVMQTEQRLELVANHKNVVGELVFAVALATDPLGFFMDQLDPRGDAVTLAVQVADRMVFTTQIAVGARMHLDWKSLEDFGLTRTSTMSDLMIRFSALSPTDRALVAA